MYASDLDLLTRARLGEQDTTFASSIDSSSAHSLNRGRRTRRALGWLGRRLRRGH
ncbi:hypothetical protein [Deinococcus wulumuqiensis]|uniref:hypothetical protein n=1 Tax=Deinococcus wulumuqiensis TaxID=980427 RepID=UPI0003450736|nr:hypothetical protein [Deinococcus wulumuqiensis]QII20531.1 hypothetical protein G6R31_06995 [Deinococcus wulumuqiensis R12]